jgi:ABC-2 type transport system ATP-binding protein
MMTSHPTLEVAGLRRAFSGGSSTPKVALEHVDLRIAEGEIVGVLGVNGAGKTTLIKIISTLLLPTTGTVRVCGHDVVREARQVRALTSMVLGGERGLYGRLTALDNLRFFAMLSGLSRAEVGRSALPALEAVGLGEAAHGRVETFSRGMRQRLHLAIGLIGNPKLLLLDEPTAGLDPPEAERLRQSVAKLRSEGVSVLLTSHQLLDIERLADRVVLLQSGRITHDLTLPEFLSQASTVATLVITGTGTAPSAIAQHPTLSEGHTRLIAATDSWTLEMPVHRWTPELLHSVEQLVGLAGTADVHVRPVGLEDVFQLLTEPVGTGAETGRR